MDATHVILDLGENLEGVLHHDTWMSLAVVVMLFGTNMLLLAGNLQRKANEKTKSKLMEQRVALHEEENNLLRQQIYLLERLVEKLKAGHSKE